MKCRFWEKCEEFQGDVQACMHHQGYGCPRRIAKKALSTAFENIEGHKKLCDYCKMECLAILDRLINPKDYGELPIDFTKIETSREEEE